MALTLTIGVPATSQGANSPASYLPYVDFSTIVIQNSVQIAADTMEFTLVIVNQDIEEPEPGNEVIFKDGSTIEFGGVLTSIERRFGVERNVVEILCTCQDYVYFLNRRLVNEFYASQAAGQTVKDILTDLHGKSDSDIHYSFFKDNVENVTDGAILAAFTFDKIVPSQAFDMIAQSTGMQWWIDFDKKVYFKVLNSKKADFLLYNNLDVTKYIDTHFDFEESESVDGVATQIILRDITLLSTANQVDVFTGSQGTDHQSETNKIFKLSRTPFSFLHVTSVSKNTGSGAVNQDLKYEDIDGQTPDGTGGSDDVFIFVKDEGSYVRFASANAVGDTNVIIVTYKYVITDDLEDPDFTTVDEMKRRTGGDGIHQFIYHQTSGMRFIDLDDAEHVTDVLRQRKSKILRRGSFKSRLNIRSGAGPTGGGGWQAGQTFYRLWRGSVLQLEQMHIISVTKIILTPDDSNNAGLLDGLAGGTTYYDDPIIESTIVFSNVPYGIAF